ncbi:MAG: diadenylate cyclase [Proteobacteria bacterium]|nr:diadenylate cyclase [Pseudomonadota bacterium]
MDALQAISQFIKDALTWRVVLDVFFMGASLFLLYRTFMRLGSWTIVRGVLLAIVAFAVANVLQLQGIMWAYSNLSQVAVIGLIILFQPELRKVLEQAVSISSKDQRYAETGIADPIAEGLFRVAERRWGALLVLPGKEPIGRHLSGGQELNARPSPAIIQSIFDPNSPGHDGAVVVEKGSLALFGVRLPLSKTNVLPYYLGTRHNAAMGLCEASDALIVAVSEERGTITLFRNGTYRTVEDQDELVGALNSQWTENSQYRPVWGPAMRKSKLVIQAGFCLAVAFIFWATIIHSQGEILERVFTVPVEYTATPADLALVGSKPEEVKIHLSGPKSELNPLRPNQLIVTIDLSKGTSGEKPYFVTEDNIALPRNVSLLGVEPESFRLTLKRIIKQEVKLKPQLVGRLADHLVLKEVVLTPESIVVLFPEEKKGQKPPEVTTTPIYLDGIKTTTAILCKIIVPPGVQPADKKWPDVQVVLNVEEEGVK